MPFQEPKHEKVVTQPPKPVLDISADNTEAVPITSDPTHILSADGTAPSIQHSADSIARMASSQARQQAVRSLQIQHGNAYTAKIVRRMKISANPVPVIQRHDPGVPLLGGIAAAPAAASSAPVNAVPTPNSAPDDGGTAAPTPAPATSAATAAPAVGQSTPGATPNEAEATPSSGPTETGGTPAPTGPVPIPLAMPTLQTAFAQNAIRSAFGSYTNGRAIVPGTITVVADSAALYAVYDNWMIAHHMPNSDTGHTWAAGDKLRWNTTRSLRTNAFAEPEPSTNIFIDATQTDPTATIHEMLHVNTAAGFVGEVGRAVNEGITERLAVQAVSRTGNAVTGSERTYVSERDVVTALINVVGEPAVTQAYFQGAGILIRAYNVLMGGDAWAILKRTLNDTPQGYTAATALLVPPSTTQKIAAINTLLDWWVSDNDLTRIEWIFTNVSATERPQIVAAIQPRIGSLSSSSQQARLRSILGLPPAT